MKPVVLFIALLMGTCGEQNRVAQPLPEGSPVQEVHIAVTTLGYDPPQITLKTDQPIRLVFTRQADSDCASQVQSEDLGIALTDLPLGEAFSIDVDPQEAGTYTFVCGMNMLKGTLIVAS